MAAPPSHPPGLPYGAPCAGSCFFISEYVEAADGSTNTFLEFYNGCGGAIELGDYAMLLCRDGCESAAPGSGWPTGALQINLPAGRQLAVADTFVITYCENRNSANCADWNLIANSECAAFRIEPPARLAS